MEELKARPPYVSFETRAVEDRAASVDAGHYVAKDEIYAIITPAGSKDRTERVASEWFEQLAEQVRQERFPAEWLRSYKAMFKEWQEGNEPAVDGTDVRHWSVASPAQVAMLLNFKVRTVEDLSVANEETIGRLGMGARALKQRAIDWLAASKDSGKLTETVSSLRNENAALKERNEVLEARVKELEALASAAPKKL